MVWGVASAVSRLCDLGSGFTFSGAALWVLDLVVLCFVLGFGAGGLFNLL